MLNVGNRRAENSGRSNGVTCMLSMYETPPIVEVTLEEFEQFAINRLRALKAVENFRLGSTNVKEKGERLEKVLLKNLPLRSAIPTNSDRAQEDMLRDVLSHYFLRIAFCQTEELRRWFIQQESVLFRYRLDNMMRAEKLMFMKENGILFDEVSMSEIEKIKDKLTAVRDSCTLDRKERLRPLCSYFKVGARRVYIENGSAYVPFDQVVSILATRFRASLSKALAQAYRKYNRSTISRDGRLIPILNNLAKHHIDADYIGQSSTVFSSREKVTPETLDMLSRTSMPLCMRNLHKALLTDHHLRFTGRQQYGLFLKGTGLQLEDAIAFWRQHFCKRMTVDEFNKTYAYNIRHNYGKEGKRKDYVPYSCMSIITGNPPKSGEHHGCPYRHSEKDRLRKMLDGVKEHEKDEIIRLVNGRHFQVACKKYFELQHPEYNGDLAVNHPNKYFEESRRYHTERTNSANEEA
uniref:DNA primase large subunit n=1 Tax=Albugo laibachii Nc14 TaxID=890382 RepID=F0W5S7_9STRA|nr:DNA primase putative [Albugo laibachii Nc14]|eukprot:CCA16468.1 DNA primase putative [Albugo laibachii Nc14]